MGLEPLADSSRPLRPTILVVDDDLGLRESFRLILEDEYEVVDVHAVHFRGPIASSPVR